VDFLATPLAASWAIATSAIALFLSARAARSAPWRLLADGFRLHGWLGACLAIALAWILSARPLPGLSLHLLATPLVALMFGRQLGLVAAVPAVLAAWLWRGSEWTGLGATWLLAAWVPVMVADGLRRLADRYAPLNPFTFIFLQGFFASGLAFAAGVAAATLAHGAAGTVPWPRLTGEFLPYGLLLSWGEAFLSGLLTAIFVVYEPRWMAGFDDARYLKPPAPGGR
jgi:uncharacterized membrane protein